MMGDDSGDRSEAENAALQSIGLPDNAIHVANTVFGTPERAIPWVEVLKASTTTAEALAPVVEAGITPDMYVRWRDANVDLSNFAKAWIVLATAGLGPEHVERWRAAKLNTLNLPVIAPYLSNEFDFETVVDILEEWHGPIKPGTITPRAEELIRVLETGAEGSIVAVLRKSGVPGEVIVRWSKSGVPAADWSRWIEMQIRSDVAARFFASNISPDEVEDWLDAGASAASALTHIQNKVPLGTVRDWIAEGFSIDDAASFLAAGASLIEARAWSETGLSGADAADFIAAGVLLDEARPWIESELPSDESADFISKGVSLERAVRLARRGIGSHQLELTEDGLEMNHDPWQEDPAEQLPDVIKPGHFGMTLWSMSAGGDYTAYDVTFTWDGARGADWYQDISMANASMSMASSSPIHGTADWSDGRDVHLTYDWPDLGYEGTDTLSGFAPTSAKPDSDGGARDPESWIRLGHALIEWVYRTF